MSKTHYAEVERATESNPIDFWTKTACGLEYTESPMTDNWKYVDCKKCLKSKDKIQNQHNLVSYSTQIIKSEQ